MRLKSLLTIAASLFVAAGVIALTLRAYRSEPSAEAAQQRGAAQIDISRSERIAAYYSYRTERPSTCTATESIVKAAIESAFPEQPKDGRLDWCSVNYEEPGNEHYASDYKLTAPCLVLARIKGGKPVEWRSLSEVRELADNKPVLVRLVQRNVQEFLDYIRIPGACCL